MFFYLVNEKSFYLIYQKSLSHIIRTQKSLLQLVLLLIPNQATLYKKKTSSIPVPVMHSTQSTIKVKLRKKIIPHLTQITENNCFKKFWITQLLVIKYKSNIHKISQIKEYTKSYVSWWGMSYFELSRFSCTPELLHYTFISWLKWIYVGWEFINVLPSMH